MKRALVGFVRPWWVTGLWRWAGMVVLVWAAMLGSAVPGTAMAEPAKEMELLLKTVGGQPLRLADLRGKVVVVNFWATWCPPCLAEIPELVRFHERYGNKGVVVLGIDYMDHVTLEQLQQFVVEHHISYPVVYGETAQLDQVAKMLGGVFGLPVTKLLNQKGQLVASRVGGVTEKDLQNWVDPLLVATSAAR
ncbi:MAG: TlpA family protein disulfide reductase [Magnetococcales bacterium]|nr:TlpA family protein disulfide reductase [Magnetococcales bacterium]